MTRKNISMEKKAHCGEQEVRVTPGRTCEVFRKGSG